MDFHIHRAGQQLGPYSEETVQQMLQLGSLAPTDLAWCEGLTDWLPISELLSVPEGPASALVKPTPTTLGRQRVTIAPAHITAHHLPEGESFSKQLPGAFVYPFRRDGMILLTSGSVFYLVVGLLSGYSLVIGVFGFGYILAYLQNILRSSAAGDKDMPNWPDFSDFADDILVPFFQFFATTLVCFTAPVLLSHYIGLSHPGLAILGNSLVALGAIYYPMALLAVTMFETLAALNPLLVVRSILRIGKCYILAAGVLFALAGLGFLVESLPRRISLPVVPSLVAGAFTFYLLIVVMRILGLLYFTQRNRLGWF